MNDLILYVFGIFWRWWVWCVGQNSLPVVLSPLCNLRVSASHSPPTKHVSPRPSETPPQSARRVVLSAYDKCTDDLHRNAFIILPPKLNYR
eukprot:2514621-Amphidinium_carterae.1